MNSLKFKIGLCTIIIAFSWGTVGCGSDNNSKIAESRKDQKLTAKKNVKVMELLVNGAPKQGAPMKPGIPSRMEPSNLLVSPPGNPGERGVAYQEVEAAIKASKNVDPETIVIPPRKPGERGITKREVDAALKASKNVDPETIVIPPKPGELGISLREVRAIIAKHKYTASDAQEASPLPLTQK